MGGAYDIPVVLAPSYACTAIDGLHEHIFVILVFFHEISKTEQLRHESFGCPMFHTKWLKHRYAGDRDTYNIEECGIPLHDCSNRSNSDGYKPPFCCDISRLDCPQLSRLKTGSPSVIAVNHQRTHV